MTYHCARVDCKYHRVFAPKYLSEEGDFSGRRKDIEAAM